MKKSITIYTMLFLITTLISFAQVRPVKTIVRGEAVEINQATARDWDTQIPQDCFCCNEKVYNLPLKPKITGESSIPCGNPAKFSTNDCPGAIINWSVLPSIPFTGQGTGTIIFNPPMTAGNYTLTVSIKCGNKTYSSQKPFTVTRPENCIPNFLVTVKQLANGGLNIDAVPTATAGVEHYWGVVYNGTYPNCTTACTPIELGAIQNATTFGAHVTAAGAFSPLGMGTNITGGTAAPYGFNYSGFPNNSCFKITHYVKCCGTWYRQTQCVSIGTSNAKVAPGTIVTPSIIIGEAEKVN